MIIHYVLQYAAYIHTILISYIHVHCYTTMLYMYTTYIMYSLSVVMSLTCSRNRPRGSKTG